MKIFLYLFTLLLITNLQAQLPHTFTQVARNTHYGSAWGVAVGSDDTVFLANLYDGLRAYSYDGTSFVNTAHINDIGEAQSVAVGLDGTVFSSQSDLLIAPKE